MTTTGANGYDADRHRWRPQRAGHAPRTSARPGCGRSCSSGARRSVARPTTSELAPGIRVPTLAHTVGRLRPSVVRDLDLKRHGLSLVGPDVRVFAPDRRRRGDRPVGRSRPGPPRACARDRPPTPARYAAFDRLVRSLAGFLGEIAGQTPPDIESPGPDRRPGRAQARPDVPRPRARRRPDDHPRPADGRSPTSWPNRSRPMRSGPPSPGAASSTPRWARGRPARRPSCSPTRPATTAERPARPSSRGAGPGALVAALESAAREAGVEIRTGAEVVSITSRDGRATGRRAGRRRGAERPRPSSPASTRSAR